MSNPLEPTRLSSVKFDPLLSRLGTNDLVGGASLRFYHDAVPIESHWKTSVVN
jgi:hypothetical protein